jgi:arylsulfatase A-like enzyme
MTVGAALLSAILAAGATQLASFTPDFPAHGEGRTPRPDGPRRKVLIFGIDGCRWDAVQAARAPNFDRLARQGTLALNTDVLGPRDTGADTVSGPCWSSILTGVYADKHGVRDNSFKGDRYRRYPHFFRRLKEAWPEARTVSVESWGAIHDYIVDGADVSLAPRGDDEDDAAGDQHVTEQAKAILAADDPDAMFVYFGNLDTTGHREGYHPAVAPYRRAIETIDRQVGEVLATVEARPTYDREDWLILVCTDHGGLGTHHSGGQNSPEVRRVFLIASGPAARRGIIEEPTYLVDVAATALAHLSVPVRAEWGLDGRPFGLREREAAAATVE